MCECHRESWWLARVDGLCGRDVVVPDLCAAVPERRVAHDGDDEKKSECRARGGGLDGASGIEGTATASCGYGLNRGKKEEGG